jgi:hypothetical protein
LGLEAQAQRVAFGLGKGVTLSKEGLPALKELLNGMEL